MPCSHRVLPSADLRHNRRTVDVPAATVLSGAEGFGMVEIRGTDTLWQKKQRAGKRLKKHFGMLASL